VNAAWLWVVFPLVAGLGLGLWPRGSTRQKRWVAAAIAGGLALVAWKVPLGHPVPLFGYRWSWLFTAEWRLAGHAFVLDDAARGWLAALFAWAALWAWTAAEARMAPDFLGWTLALPAWLTWALAARDPFDRALLLSLAQLGLVFLWLPYHRRALGPGLMRALAWNALGLPLLLLALTQTPGLETASPETPAVQQAGLLLGLGVALWAGVFPFHTVYPLVGREVHPFRAGFGWWFTHTALVLAMAHWAAHFLWLRENPALYTGLRALGVGTLALAGVLLAVQRDLGRAVGYVAWLNTGWTWLALAQGLEQGTTAFLALAWPRALLWLGWTWALAVLMLPDDAIHRFAPQGRGRASPWVAALVVLGLGAWAPWPGLNLAPWSAALVAGASPNPGLLLGLGVAFAGLTGTAWRWAQQLFVEPLPKAPPWRETWRERGLVLAWLLLWVVVAWMPGLWHQWATAASSWLP